MLTKLIFCSLFYNWVMALQASGSFSIAINGHVHGSFSGKKGLR